MQGQTVKKIAANRHESILWRQFLCSAEQWPPHAVPPLLDAGIEVLFNAISK
jgi:hypothetical protein